MAKSIAVFLDRDGTILNERGYLASHEQLRFYKDIFLPLRRLQEKGLKLIVVTNQSGVGRGYFSLKQMNKVNQKFKLFLLKKGVRLTDIFTCPHHPTKGCSCRKPRLGMVKKAARRYKLDLKRSYVVGDQVRDVQMAKKMQGTGILVLTGAGQSVRKKALAFGPHVSKNLAFASKWILNDLKD